MKKSQNSRSVSEAGSDRVSCAAAGAAARVAAIGECRDGCRSPRHGKRAEMG